MRLKLFTLLILTLSILSAGMDTTPFKQSLQLGGDLSIEKMREQNINVVQKAVEGLNQNLPVEIDRSTKLVKVEGKDTRLIYTFEIKTAPKSDKELIEEGRTKVAPRVKKGLCHSADRFLQAGIDITYIYQNSATGNTILELNVTKKDCPNLQ